jgi:hypothetical protein
MSQLSPQSLQEKGNQEKKEKEKVHQRGITEVLLPN